MFIIDAIITSFQTILNHKFRSFLTLLGILIGITSVVAMFATVNGVRLVINDRIQGMGWNNSLVITAGGRQRSQIRMGRGGSMVISETRTRRASSLNYRDFESLSRELDYKYIYGMLEMFSRSPTSREWFRIRATTEDFFHANTYILKEGRFFNAFELTRGLKVCIVGPEFSDTHLEGRDPIGNYFTAEGHRFLIIGVLDTDPLNSENGMSFNPWGRAWDLRAVYIPLKTGAMYLRQNMAVESITAQAYDSDSFADMRNHATHILLANHNMQRNFSFQDVSAEMLQFTSQMNEMFKNWSIALVAIATISLFVGGIGLFSTLLISINERMVEIGIRKSVGARNIDIFFYFIVESITLALIASGIGIILGLLLTYGLGFAIKTPIPVSMLSIYIGLAFAFVIGFISGLYPAIKAANINPIQAIYFFE